MPIDPSAVLEKAGPQALIEAIPELLEEEDSSLELLMLLQSDALPPRWHKRAAAKATRTFLDGGGHLEDWLADWVEVIERHERLHPSERPQLWLRRLRQEPTDEAALVGFVSCQIEDELLYDGGLGSLVDAGSDSQHALLLIEHLLSLHIGGWEPSRELALEHVDALSSAQLERVEDVLAQAGWSGALRALAAPES